MGAMYISVYLKTVVYHSIVCYTAASHAVQDTYSMCIVHHTCSVHHYLAPWTSYVLTALHGGCIYWY